MKWTKFRIAEGYETDLFQLEFVSRRTCEMGSDRYDGHLKKDFTLREFINEILNDAVEGKGDIFDFGTLEVYQIDPSGKETKFEPVHYGRGEKPDYEQPLEYLNPLLDRQVLSLNAWGAWNNMDYNIRIKSK